MEQIKEMIALFGFLIIIIISIVIVRIGAIALELTGLSKEVASFQAQSAFSGVGFTTAESETIVSHPLRRRIVKILILLGSAGLTSSIATLVLTFVGQSGESIAIRSGILILGLGVIYLFSRSEFIYRIMKKVIIKALEKYTSLKIYDYQEILGISKGYSISRIVVRPGNWMIGCSLKDLKLESEGILILSIHRIVDGEEKFVGVPTGETVIYEGDILICYGQGEVLKKLSKRVKGIEGDKEHQAQVKVEEKAAQLRKERGGYC